MSPRATSMRPTEAVRLRHRRRGICRLRAGGPAHRGWQAHRARPRVRRLGPLPLRADALRALHPDGHGEVRLALLLRAGTGPRRPQAAHAARQGAGRLLLDQRARLRARQCAGFRPLGAGRRGRLELRGRAALLPARGDARRGRRRVPRRLGPAPDALRPAFESAACGLARGRPPGRAIRTRPTSTATSRKVSAAST